jgi:hypothetical protein
MIKKFMNASINVVPRSGRLVALCLLLSSCSTAPETAPPFLGAWRPLTRVSRCTAVASDPGDPEHLLVAGEGFVGLVRIADGVLVRSRAIPLTWKPELRTPLLWHSDRILVGTNEKLQVLKRWDFEEERPLPPGFEASLTVDRRTGTLYSLTDAGLYSWDAPSGGWLLLQKGYQALASHPASNDGTVLAFGGTIRTGQTFQPFDRSILRGSRGFWRSPADPSFLLAADIPSPCTSRDAGRSWTPSETRMTYPRHCAGLDTPTGPVLFVESHSGKSSGGVLSGPSVFWSSRDGGRTFAQEGLLPGTCTSMTVAGNRLVVLVASGSVLTADITP